MTDETAPDSTPDAIIELYKRDVDRTLLRENLKKTVTERLRMNAELLEFGNEIHRAMKDANEPK